MKTIPEGLLDEVVRRLADEFDPTRIILFGSHAGGEPDEDSDVDLLVIVPETDERIWDLVLRGRLRLSDLDFPKDLLVRTEAEFNRFVHLKCSMEYRIAESGVVLYDAVHDRRGEGLVREGSAGSRGR
jgi:uncharacterized protein